MEEIKELLRTLLQDNKNQKIKSINLEYETICNKACPKLKIEFFLLNLKT